tara:strand:+ start:4095 stop:5093 length:999 start_codon:yes stop_codon:yes gene_type:complete
MKPDNNFINEKYLIEIIFKNKNITRELIKELDFEQIIKIASSQLLLPLLYSKIKKNNKTKIFPKEFIEYLKNIYIINKNRNEKLMYEASLISKSLNNKNIKHVFLKGTEYLKMGLYDDIGERMIGDIDVLVDKEDLHRASDILNNMGYKNNFNYKFWRTKHLPRFSSINKLFAVELHSEVIIYRHRKKLSGSKMISDYENNEHTYLMKLCILNFLFNDYGWLNPRKDLRSFYDYILIRKYSSSINLSDKNYRKFLILIDEIGIEENEFKRSLNEKIYMIRMKGREKYYWFNLIDKFICNLVILTPMYFMQIIEFVFNKKYRANVFLKIKASR